MAKVHTATLDDKDGIIRVAKMNKYTKGVSNPMFMNDASFDKGWVGVVRTKSGTVCGFTVVRHLVRYPYTSLYYVGVAPGHQGHGVGLSLVRWVMKHSPHGCIRLICEQENTDSVDWYKRHGFRVIEEGANKANEPYWRFEVNEGELK